jgi:hypothetical protein
MIRFSTIMMFLFILCMAGLVFTQVCIAENTPESYSKLLRDVINQAEMTHIGIRVLAGPVQGMDMPGMSGGIRADIPFMSGDLQALTKKEAVPFLLDVIRDGPDWSKEFMGTQRLIPHVGRCYAVLCLASTRDARAYPVLMDLLKHGQCLFNPNNLREEIAGTIKHRIETGGLGLMDNVSDPNYVATATARSIATLTQAIRRDYNIRSYAAAGLGILKDNRAVKSLITVMDNESIYLRHNCMFALTKIDDVRAIGSILDAGIKYKIEDWEVVDQCMQIITKIKIEGWKLFTFIDFPEPDDIQLEEYPSLKGWLYWYKNGKNWTELKFDEYYTMYKNNANKVIRKKMVDLGIAVLPLIIKKIEQGESDFISMAAELTDNKVNRDSKSEDVIKWWKENKTRWQIYD